MESISANASLSPPENKTLSGGGNLKSTSLKDKMFLDVDTVPWTEFSIPGTHFRLLMINGERTTMMVKQDVDCVVNPHKHDTPVELYLLEGSVGYKEPETGEEFRIYKNGYMYEPPGTVHEPVTSGSLGLAILHGPITGFNDKGESVSVSAQDLYDMAKRNDAVAHFEPRNTDWF